MAGVLSSSPSASTRPALTAGHDHCRPSECVLIQHSAQASVYRPHLPSTTPITAQVSRLAPSLAQPLSCSRHSRHSRQSTVSSTCSRRARSPRNIESLAHAASPIWSRPQSGKQARLLLQYRGRGQPSFPLSPPAATSEEASREALCRVVSSPVFKP